MDGWKDQSINQSINLDMDTNQIEEVPNFSQRERGKHFLKLYSCLKIHLKCLTAKSFGPMSHSTKIKHDF